MRYCVVVVGLLLILSGCAAVPETVLQVTLHSETINATANGISVVQITVLPYDKDSFENLDQFGEAVGSLKLQESIKLEGIQLLKIVAIDVPAIVASIGDVENETYAWHGQILEWRDLHQRAIDQDGMLISAEGIPHFIQKGTLTLLGRSWLIEREYGLSMYLQCMPTWHVPNNGASIFTQTPSPVQNKVFSNLQLETLLLDGEAILLAVYLRAPEESSGPQDYGPPPVRLGEALLGGPVEEDVVQLLVIEANIMPRM